METLLTWLTPGSIDPGASRLLSIHTRIGRVVWKSAFYCSHDISGSICSRNPLRWNPRSRLFRDRHRLWSSLYPRCVLIRFFMSDGIAYWLGSTRKSDKCFRRQFVILGRETDAEDTYYSMLRLFCFSSRFSTAYHRAWHFLPRPYPHAIACAIPLWIKEAIPENKQYIRHWVYFLLWRKLKMKKTCKDGILSFLGRSRNYTAELGSRKILKEARVSQFAFITNKISRRSCLMRISVSWLANVQPITKTDHGWPSSSRWNLPRKNHDSRISQ